MNAHFLRSFASVVLACLAWNGAVAVEPDESFDVASLHVERFGNHGPPVVLVPGLACGSWVWKDAIAHLRDHYSVYAVTLAGFDGRPANGGEGLAQAAASLHELVLSRHLGRPLIVGHSMGGTLGLLHAEQHPDEISALVSLDGLPVFPGTENLPAANREAMAEAMRAQLDAGTQEQFESQQLAYMRAMGVAREEDARDLAKRTSRSDRHAVAAYAASDIRIDLRPGLADIKVPVLEIVPYDASERESLGMQAADKVAYYRSLLAGVTRLALTPVSPSRHFAMVDQSTAFLAVLDGFLATLGK